jgi:serine/threonine protein kinase/WD40 repeat protein
MNRPDEPPPTAPTAHESGTGDQAAVDDPRVIAAVEEYLAALETGLKPDRQQFLAGYPREVAAALAECLDGLELVQSAGAELQPRTAGRPPEVLGDFRLIREVGRGGMGVVYEAEQVSLRRRVALKVLSAAGGLDARQLQRFRTEAQAAGALHHPHIAPVYAVGSERGVHYYAMQFIDGPSLAGVIADRRRQAGLAPRAPQDPYGWVALPDPRAAAVDKTTIYRPLDRMEEAVAGAPNSLNGDLSAVSHASGKEFWRTAARLGAEAAEALDHAHQQGIVHRDIKPANLLLDGAGRLWVVDFGLARLPSDAGLTLTGDLLGTLRYMSPEQALAKRLVVDHRTDVYSLGVTLYELLTLRPAFPGSDRQDLLRRIADEEPAAPRKLDRSIPADLETVVLKAMAKEPAERYATAQELADDLRRFLDDRPIVARRPRLSQRAWRWGRRHRRLACGMSVAAVLLPIGLALGFGGWQQQVAEQEKKLRTETQATLYHKLFGHAQAVRGERRPGYRAEVWADLHKAAGLDVPDKDANAIATEVIACLADALGLPPVKNPDAERAFPAPPAVGEDGIVRATAPTGKASAEALADSVVWVRTQGRPPISRQSPRGRVNRLRFSSDGGLLAVGCEEGFVVWKVPTLEVHANLGGRKVDSLAFHPRGHLLATVGGQVELWSLASNKPVAVMPNPGPAALEVEFSADGRLLLGLVDGKAVVGWPVSDTPERRQLAGHLGGVPGVAFSPDGRRLASVSRDQTVKIWDVGTGRLLHTGKSPSAPMECLAFSPDGRLLATGDLNGQVQFWDPEKGDLIAKTPDPPAEDAKPNPSPRARFLTAEKPVDPREQLGEVFQLRFDAAGKWLAAAGTNGVQVWAIRPVEGGVTLEPSARLRTETPAYDLAVRPDGSALVFATRGGPGRGQLYRYDLDGKAPQRPLDAPARLDLRALHFDPAGRLLTYVTPEGRLGRWDWENGASLPAVGGDQPVSHTALAPDGRWVAVVTPDRGVAICESDTGKRVLALPPEESDVWSLARAADGRRLAVGLSDGGVAVWDLEEVRARLAEFDIDLPLPRAARK